jgi:hypothetical protein
MTQFMMLRGGERLRLPPQTRLYPVSPHDDFLAEVAREHFGSVEGCRMLVDRSGVSAPLIDEVWEAQIHGRDVADTTFASVAAQFIQSGTEFICWHASDFRHLPVVSSWSGFLAELRSQTHGQPADFWVRYQPPDRPRK